MSVIKYVIYGVLICVNLPYAAQGIEFSIFTVSFIFGVGVASFINDLMEGNL